MVRYNPVTTYRLQFNNSFTLKDAEKIIPYLRKSGIKTIYASPVLQAVKGSIHGYDVTNPLKINPELGTEEDFIDICNKIHEKDMGWIQDIVPNHMAFSTENPWIYDVLEKGKNSIYYEFFDILDNHPDKNLGERLMLPFFGKSPEKMIEDKELTIGFNEEGIKLKYFDNEYPLSVPAYPKLLEAEQKAYIPETVAAFLNAEKNIKNFKENWHRLFIDYSNSPATKAYVDECISAANSSLDKLKTIINNLFYYPAFWKDTESKINYRRFFTINGLICLNIQNNKVFEITHKLIEDWLAKKIINGLRIDHVDGLYNPGNYLNKLREISGEDVYITVEKILDKDETLPEDWPVEGSTGYDFLGLVNNLLTNPVEVNRLYSYYNEWTDKTPDYKEIYYTKRRFILYNRLEGELDNLTREFISLESVRKQEVIWERYKNAIGEFMVFCPLYKIYYAPSSFTAYEKRLIKAIIKKAVNVNKKNEKALKFLEEMFLLKNPLRNEEISGIDKFFRHCMQYTGSLMAKGIEDTAFYSYIPFIAHNEVGDSPDYSGNEIDTFHNFMKERQINQPLTINAISTHDTKRGEDARARLNVLSDIPERWIETTKKWQSLNHPFKKYNKKEIPSSNDEYFIYQTLCAHLPMNAKIDESFLTRLQKYLTKAMREAKENSSWDDPDKYYENITIEFTRDILSTNPEFRKSLLLFMEEVIPHGIINSLSQLILKNTVPGVPDTFQGAETWNLSFVDPDNRQPVDFQKLSANLDEIINKYNKNTSSLAEELWQKPINGKIKQWINWLTLNERIKYENLFLKGNYIPLKITGKYKEHIIAFYRNYSDMHLVTVLPLNTATMPVIKSWEETLIELPRFNFSHFENRLTKEKLKINEKVNISDIFSIIPFGILRNINP